MLLTHAWALAVGAGILFLQSTALWSQQANALVVAWLVASALSLCLVRRPTSRCCSYTSRYGLSYTLTDAIVRLSPGVRGAASDGGGRGGAGEDGRPVNR